LLDDTAALLLSARVGPGGPLKGSLLAHLRSVGGGRNGASPSHLGDLVHARAHARGGPAGALAGRVGVVRQGPGEERADAAEGKTREDDAGADDAQKRLEPDGEARADIASMGDAHGATEGHVAGQKMRNGEQDQEEPEQREHARTHVDDP